MLLKCWNDQRKFKFVLFVFDGIRILYVMCFCSMLNNMDVDVCFEAGTNNITAGRNNWEQEVQQNSMRFQINEKFCEKNWNLMVYSSVRWGEKGHLRHFLLPFVLERLLVRSRGSVRMNIIFGFVKYLDQWVICPKMCWVSFLLTHF